MSEIVTPAFIATLVFGFTGMIGAGVLYAKMVQTKKISDRTFYLIYIPLLMLPTAISVTYIGWPDMNFIVRLLITVPFTYVCMFYSFFVTRLFVSRTMERMHREEQERSKKRKQSNLSGFG